MTWLPDLRRDFGHPLGNLGIAFVYTGSVIDVAPLAAEAGVKVGDRMDLAHATPAQRYAEFNPETVAPDTVVAIPLTDPKGRHYVAKIVTQPETPNVPVIVLRQLAALLFLALGAFLVLRKPNKATWAFFIFSLGGGAPINDFYLIGPTWWKLVAFMWGGNLLTWVPPFFGALFAVNLLHEGPLPAWRRRVEFAIYAVLLATIACGFVYFTRFMLFGINWERGDFIVDVLWLAAYVSIPVILVATYAESDARIRERLRWVIWAFGIAAVAVIVDSLGTQGNLGFYVTTYFEHSLLTLAYSLLPAAAVVYAVLKHRVMDVNFAISRAVVYAVLSTVIVGSFALVDLFFTSALSAGRIGLFADVGLALILGFSFNAIHARVDRFMDWLFFRSRHLAEQHVATVASAIPFARTQEHVNRLLINEPVRAFGLSNGILMRLQADGVLQFVHGAESERHESPASDPESLVAILKAQHKAWRLSDHHMAVAVPIFSDTELEAIAFYAPHKNGTDIDGDELSLIERAAEAAGGAYARFRAATLRDRVTELEEENALLRTAAALS